MLAVETGGRGLRGLIYDDDKGVVARVSAAMSRSGFEVCGPVGTVADAVRTAVAEHPDVIVLALDVSGPLGLGLLPVLHAVAPSCAIVVLSSFDTLSLPALEAGAYELLADDDMAGLERALRRLASEAARVRNGVD